MVQKTKKLLVHVCCGPDFTTAKEKFGKEYQFAGFFYNPNIYPAAEYALRLSEAKKVAAIMGIELIEGKYDPEKWEIQTSGLEKEPEGGKRCELCFEMRLRETALIAATQNFDAFTTTLTISPHKKSRIIHAIGEKAGTEAGVEFLKVDLKKKDGFKRSVELSRKLKLYRQHYCGCRYSMRKGLIERAPFHGFTPLEGPGSEGGDAINEF